MYSQVVALRSSNNNNKKKHVTSGIVARNVLSSTKCVGGSRDKRSLIKDFCPRFYHAPRDFFNIFTLNLLLKPFFPHRRIRYPPRSSSELPKRVFLWLHVDAWLEDSSIAATSNFLSGAVYSWAFGQWPTVGQWPTEIWSCHWLITPCVDIMLWAIARNLQCESSLTPETTWDPTLSKVNNVDWQFTEIFGLNSKRWAPWN
jgi:hypothetical protein